MHKCLQKLFRFRDNIHSIKKLHFPFINSLLPLFRCNWPEKLLLRNKNKQKTKQRNQILIWTFRSALIYWAPKIRLCTSEDKKGDQDWSAFRPGQSSDLMSSMWNRICNSQWKLYKTAIRTHFYNFVWPHRSYFSMWERWEVNEKVLIFSLYNWKSRRYITSNKVW